MSENVRLFRNGLNGPRCRTSCSIRTPSRSGRRSFNAPARADSSWPTRSAMRTARKPPTSRICRTRSSTPCTRRGTARREHLHLRQRIRRPHHDPHPLHLVRRRRSRRIVTTSDFTRTANNFGGVNKHWYEGDFNNDGMVNALDFNALASNFGFAISAPIQGSLVPEPSAMLLVGTFAFGIRTRKRRC
jgi:hypothetical protein